jgi:hypothetical protein
MSGKQITTVVVAICAAVVAAPVAVGAATGSLINITDPYTAANKARVNAKGAVAVTARDGVTGVQAKIDAAGKTLVSDGGTSLTVDGTVNARPAIPAAASRFHVTAVAAASDYPIDTVPVPAGKSLAITDIVFTNVGGAGSYVRLEVATSSDAACTADVVVSRELTILAAPAYETSTASLASALVIPASAGNRCLQIFTAKSGEGNASTTVTGFSF